MKGHVEFIETKKTDLVHAQQAFEAQKGKVANLTDRETVMRERFIKLIDDESMNIPTLPL